jgi:hypothetical protein
MSAYDSELRARSFGWRRKVSYQRIAGLSLRIVGGLLILLGVIHIAATPHIPALLEGSPRGVYERAVGPTVLNHVLAGILLLPLGYTTWLAAGASNLGKGWARRVLLVNILVVLTMPALIILLMRQPEYYASPLFLAGVGLSAAVSLLMVAAGLLLLRTGNPP